MPRPRGRCPRRRHHGPWNRPGRGRRRHAGLPVRCRWPAGRGRRPVHRGMLNRAAVDRIRVVDGPDGFAGWHFVVGAIIEDIEINEPRHRDAVHALPAAAGTPVTVVRDSSDFVAQRIFAMIDGRAEDDRRRDRSRCDAGTDRRRTRLSGCGAHLAALRGPSSSMLGIAPTVVRTQMTHGAESVARHDPSSLRLTISVGEPWNPEAWLWFFDCAALQRAIKHRSATKDRHTTFSCLKRYSPRHPRRRRPDLRHRRWWATRGRQPAGLSLRRPPPPRRRRSSRARR